MNGRDERRLPRAQRVGALNAAANLNRAAVGHPTSTQRRVGTTGLPNSQVIVMQPDGTLAFGKMITPPGIDTSPQQGESPASSTASVPLDSLAKGGKIKKTGLYRLHAGELVVKKELVAAVKKAVKAAKLRPLKE